MSIIEPNDLVTNEMLDPQTAERILVIENHGKFFESVCYNGLEEFEAYKIYKSIAHNDKIIAKVMLTYSNLSKQFCDKQFILSYKILEIIKKGSL